MDFSIIIHSPKGLCRGDNMVHVSEECFCNTSKRREDREDSLCKGLGLRAFTLREKRDFCACGLN